MIEKDSSKKNNSIEQKRKQEKGMDIEPQRAPNEKLPKR